MSKINLSVIKTWLSSALISLILSACASAPQGEKAPDWLTGPSAAYPKSEYLVGVSYAADKNAAGIAAISELVSVFGQKVTSATLASKRMVRAEIAGNAATASESSIDQSILREVNQDDVIAVELPEFYEAKNEGKWYALAVMSREKGVQIYSSMIAKNQKEISSILNLYEADKEPYTLINFSRLDFAEELAKNNEKYLKRLSVLNPKTGEAFSSIYTPVQIHKTKVELAEKIPVCVNVDDDSDGRIAKVFQEVMASFGFNTTVGSNERYVISCKNHFSQSASSNEKTKFCEYAAECALIDTFVGETLVPLSVTGREGSTSYQNAEVRAKQKIVSKVKEEFAKKFSDYLGK